MSSGGRVPCVRSLRKPSRLNRSSQKIVPSTTQRIRFVDSALLDDAVAAQDTVAQLVAATRRVRREVDGAKSWRG